MSEYHSFSLTQHLPSSRKDIRQQQRQPQFHTFIPQQEQQQQGTIESSYSNNHNDHDIKSGDIHITDQSQNDSQNVSHHNEWDNLQHHSFQSLDSILSNSQTFSGHSRHHTAPAATSNYEPLFDFLPFDDPSAFHSINETQNQHHSNHVDSNDAMDDSSFHMTIDRHDHSHIFPLDNNRQEPQHEEEESILPYFDGIEEHHYDLQQNNQTQHNTGAMASVSLTDGNNIHVNIQHNLDTDHSSNSSSAITQSSSPAVSTFFSSLSLLHQQPQRTQTTLSKNEDTASQFTPIILEERNNSTGFLEFQSPTSRINSSVSSRTTQGMINAAKMKPAIQNYLLANDPLEAGERTVIIMTSKVAQKSYGTEKRFLCPPPTAILVGSSWWTPPANNNSAIESAIFRDKDNVVRAPPNLTICISGDASDHQSGRIDWHCFSGTLIGQTGGGTINTTTTIQQSGNQSSLLKKQNEESNNNNKSTSLTLGENKASANDDWYKNSREETLAGGKCVLKRLYINDADEKRKKVECLIKVQLANGLMLGTLSSRGIKVISKPSKKRQSVKNIELCIYHGTTISLFNRIRSQTVSTKYLAVSSTSGESPVFEYPGRLQTLHHDSRNTQPSTNDTCFVARTNSWDPFIVWVVDSSSSANNAEGGNADSHADEYIGCPSIVPTIPYPNPPAIALKNKTNQPLAVRYNQHIVLQCLTTGLVSPVMIVRKVDKASTVVGGARCPEQFDPSFSGGGEFGDEVLGDPVSQLHKIALQIVQQENNSQQRQQQQQQQQQQRFQFNNQGVLIQQGNSMYGNFGIQPPETIKKPSDDPNNMMPQSTDRPSTYLACLIDIVAIHKTTSKRAPIKGIYANINPTAAAAAAESYNFTASALSATLNTSTPTNIPSSRKRRVSMIDETPQHMKFQLNGNKRVSSISDLHSHPYLHRANSVSTSAPYHDRSAMANRRSSMAVSNGQALAEFGAYWSEDVSDAAVWTIVGTECARYTFWAPPHLDENKQEEKNQHIIAPLSTPFPCLTHFVISHNDYASPTLGGNRQDDRGYASQQTSSTTMMTVSGENFTRDLQIWFGDIKAPFTEYRSREMLVCRLPSREELLQSVGLNRVHDQGLNDCTGVLDEGDDEDKKSRMPFSIRILLVRGDGVVYKTSRTYSFA